MTPRKVEVTGSVTKEMTARGSKSERPAVTLRGDDGYTYVLRKHGGPAFGDRSLVGSRLTVEGFAVGHTLIMHDWRIEN